MNVSGERRLPLEGVVVADFTRILAGPMATMVLADMGADVIKVERPDGGDDTRTWGPPFVDSDAAYFFSVNRNKRSIVLDLKDESDLTVARELIGRSHVVVENFRPGVMTGLGLGYETVRETNPGLIYCSMPAFTADDQRDLPGYDLMMQAITGFMSITGEEDGQPVKMGVALLDIIAGLYAAAAISAAVAQREAEGVGRHVEVGLFDASVSALANQASNFLLGGVVPGAYGTSHPNIVPYQAFSAKDGVFVMAAAGDRQFVAACRAIGRDDLASDPRYVNNAARLANRAALVADLDATFGRAEVEVWVKALMDAGVPAGPTRTVDQVFASPEGAARVATVSDPVRGELRLVRSPLGFTGSETVVASPPRLGEHNDEIRGWLEGLREG